MNRLASNSKTKFDKPVGASTETPVINASEELASIATLSFGKMGSAGDGLVQRQATRLADPRLRMAQRQQMAGQMGRVQGNRQLQRVAVTVGNNKVNKLLPLRSPSQTVVQTFDPRYHRAATVAGLNESGFSEVEIGQIYAANWERDFSQAHPAFGNVVLAWKGVKLAASRGEALDPKIEAFNSAVNVIVSMLPQDYLQLLEFESYGGYRYYEHMDNPASNKEISIENRNDLLKVPPGEHIPQYMVDSREYMKAQLFRAALAFRGDLEGGGASNTAGRWKQRENDLRSLVPSGRVASGGAPTTAVSNETAQQVASQLQTGKLTLDRTKNQTAAQPRPGWTPDVADGLGRAGHALEDFFAHSNFVEIAIGQPAPTVIGLQTIYSGNSQAANPVTAKPITDSKLGTGTFGENDKTHALSHKIRAIADEIENEMPLVNRVVGRTSIAPKSSDVHVGNEVDPKPDEKESLRSWIGALGVSGYTANTIYDYALGGGIKGILSSPRHPVRGMTNGIKLGLREGLNTSMREFIATPAGVFLLRQVSEKRENNTKEEANKADGSHTSLAKDQAGHATDTFGKLKTIKFQLAQELAVEANKLVIGKMNQVFSASTLNEADEQLQAIYRVLDSLIGSPEGHPLDAIVQKHRTQATAALEEYLRLCLPPGGTRITPDGGAGGSANSNEHKKNSSSGSRGASGSW